MEWEPLVRVLIAAAISLPVGLERELRGKAAGLRTHVVVAAACAALGYLSLVGVGDSDIADRTRIAAQVVTGIGFMGAGVIFASGGRVHGLTTAAALFSAAAIGLCVGMGAYVLGGALSLVTVLFLGPVDWLSDRLIGRRISDERSISLVATDIGVLRDVQDIIHHHGAEVRDLKITPLGDKIGLRLILHCHFHTARAIIDAITHLNGIAFALDQWPNE